MGRKDPDTSKKFREKFQVLGQELLGAWKGFSSRGVLDRTRTQKQRQGRSWSIRPRASSWHWTRTHYDGSQKVWLGLN